MSEPYYAFAFDDDDLSSGEPTQIYVASSWRNELQPKVVLTLRDMGFQVYDFRHPSGGKGFAWSDIGVETLEVRDGTGRIIATHDNWDNECSSPELYLQALGSPLAALGFKRDFEAMQTASIFVLVLPCERDAHLELGWAAGAGKETVILLDNPCKASLMYRMVDHISPNLDDLVEWLRGA